MNDPNTVRTTNGLSRQQVVQLPAGRVSVGLECTFYIC